MSAAAVDSGSKDALRSESFHLWRSRKDRVVRWLIAVGGVSVILAVVLIFFYLLWVVFPLFLPAGARVEAPLSVPGWRDTEPEANASMRRSTSWCRCRSIFHRWASCSC